MSNKVTGFRPPDDEWRKMKAVYDACKEAGVLVPKDVNEFFNYDEPDDKGVRVELDASTGLTEWSGECKDGYIVEIAKLPEHVTHIRFSTFY